MSNALSILIDRKISNHSIHGIRLTLKGSILTHCVFVDDTIIFGKATIEEADNILGIIQEYRGMTGQEINNDKSSIFLSANAEEATKRNITSHIRFTDTSSHATYLGVPT
ncbi:hypothetical protein LINPERPRIM_LOCUS23822 [Linum perenne]